MKSNEPPDWENPEKGQKRPIASGIASGWRDLRELFVIRANSTAKIEELIHDLKKNFSIVIVTHNMQQAGRCSDRSAFFYLGKLVEYGPTSQIFTNPKQKQTEDYISGRFG